MYDLRRSLQVLGSWIRPNTKFRARSKVDSSKRAVNALPVPLGEDAVSPYVLSPVMWPSFQGTTSSALNHRLLARAVRKTLRHVAPDKQPILVSTTPTVSGLFRDQTFRRKVYYCVDDFTQWHGINGRAMHRLEQETLNACDLMIATSTSILEARSSFVNASALLTHGVDLAHFSRAIPDPSSALAALPHPIVGMFGVFDRRVDGQALKAAALRSPQANFVVIGPVVDRDPGEFRDVPNLRFLGAVPYSDLPGHVCHFDLCVLPYVVDESTLGINPLKLKEYLATGKPVIASPLPEAIALAEYLTLADSETFAETVASVLATIASSNPAHPASHCSVHPSPPIRPSSKGLDRFLEAESWDAKAKRFLSDIMEGL